MSDEMFEEMRQAWNAYADLPRFAGITPKRRANMVAILRLDTSGKTILDAWERFCWCAAHSYAALGDAPNGYRMSLDQFLDPNNAIKVVEGGYAEVREKRNEWNVVLRSMFTAPDYAELDVWQRAEIQHNERLRAKTEHQERLSRLPAPPPAPSPPPPRKSSAEIEAERVAGQARRAAEWEAAAARRKALDQAEADEKARQEQERRRCEQELAEIKARREAAGLDQWLRPIGQATQAGA